MKVVKTIEQGVQKVKANVKNIAVIGIENIQTSLPIMLNVKINNNLEYIVSLGNVIFFENTGIYVDTIEIKVYNVSGSLYPTKSTIFYEEQNL